MMMVRRRRTDSRMEGVRVQKKIDGQPHLGERGERGQATA